MLNILDTANLGVTKVSSPEAASETNSSNVVGGSTIGSEPNIHLPLTNFTSDMPLASSLTDEDNSAGAIAFRPAPQLDGNLQVDPEIHLPSPGMNVEIAYFYNSNSNYDGPYGYGRTINTNLLVQASGSPAIVTFQRGNGAIESYQETGVGTDSYKPITPTLPNSLTKDTVNSLWKEVTPEGRVTAYPLNTTGQVVSVSYAEDAVGNRHTFSYSSGLLSTLEDAVGRKVSFSYDGSDRLEEILDWASRRTTFQYSTVAGKSVLTTVIGPSGCQTGYSYDGIPRLTGITDPNGHLTTYSYWPDGKTQQRTYHYEGQPQTTRYDYSTSSTKVTDPLNAVVTFTRYYSWNLGAYTDPLGRTVSYTRNVKGQQTEVINPLGYRWTTIYDAAGIMPVGTVDPLGHRSTVQRDVYNNPTTMIYADGSIATLIWGNDDATRARRRLLATVDSLGNRWSYSYNPRGQLASVVNPLAQCTTYNYDQWGNRISTLDAMGQLSTMAYDTAGNVVAMTDPSGRTSSIVYDTHNRPIEMLTPLGNIYTTAYDSVGNAILQIDPLGRRTSISYNVFDKPVSVQNMQGNRSTVVYDAVGRDIAQVDALGLTSTTTYDVLGRITKVKDAQGDETQWIYDVLNRNIATVYADNSRVSTVYDAANRAIASQDELGYVSTMVYDTLNRPVASIDAHGNRSTIIYDQAGRRIAQINAFNQRTSTAYDSLNRPIAAMDALNQQATLVYDVLGRVQTSIDALNHRTTFFYDVSDRPIALQDARGYLWTTTYDAQSRVVSQQAPLEAVTSWAYDAASQNTSVMDALGFVWTSTYDNLGQLQSSINPLGHTGTVVYDAVGQIVSSIDPNGHRATAIYDGVGQVVATINALGYITSLLYDVVGQPIAVQDANGHITTTVYDLRGGVIESIDALGHRTSYIYDALANLAARTDARGIVTSYSYDALNRMTGTLYPDGSEVLNTFDAISQQVTMTDSIGITTYAYDAVGRQTNVFDPQGENLAYAYDELGNRIKMSSGSQQTFYAYDAQNRLTNIVNPYAENTTIAYDALGREQERILPNGVSQSQTYDAAGNGIVREQRHPMGVAIAMYTTSYDGIGNRLNVQELDGSLVTYTYDAANQLLNESRSGSTPFSNEFNYDGVGNRLMQNRDGIVITYTHDAANAVLLAVSGASVTTFTYDENGNRTQQNANGEITSYNWDVENRLHLVTNPDSSTESYSYFGDGYRHSRTQAGDTVYYLWDGENVLEESTHSGLLAHYTDFPGYWGGLISLSGPETSPLPVAGMGAFNAIRFNAAQFNQAGSDSGVNSSFYLFDSQTSTRYLLNRDADVSDTDLYRAYGEPMVDTGSTRNPHGFQGQVGSMADSPDRVWMRARVYDALTGTWLSRDPIGFAGGDWNLYRFVANNPANMMDPSGLACWCCDSQVLKRIVFMPEGCCDSSCWETPALPRLPKKKYQDAGIDLWYENARRRGAPPTLDRPLCPSTDPNSYETEADREEWHVNTSLRVGVGYGNWGKNTAFGVVKQTTPFVLYDGYTTFNELRQEGLTYNNLRQRAIQGATAPLMHFGDIGNKAWQGDPEAFGESFAFGLSAAVPIAPKTISATTSVTKWMSENTVSWPGAMRGGEIIITGEGATAPYVRINPFLNPFRKKEGRLPHYHRRPVESTKGAPVPPGQGIGRHRPWEGKPVDKSWRDRF